MPLIKIEHIADTTLLGLWEATEPDTFFQPLPQGYLTGFSADFSAKRKKEFLASRYLLCNLLQDETAVLSRSEQGQLRIADSTWRVSLSHSNLMIAALISQRFNPGVDVEEVRPKVQRIMHKFLSDEEMGRLVDPTDLRLLTLCWSVKESVFKVMGIPALSFREEIRLQLPLRQQDNCVRVCIARPNLCTEMQVYFTFISNYVLTYCLQSILTPE